MLNPSIGKLISTHESKYGLVIAVSKRARQIAEENEEAMIHTTEKSVDIAMDEIAAGKYTYEEIV